MTTFAQNLITPPLSSAASPLPLNFKKIIQPVSSLESKLIEFSEFKTGFNWGVPRFGHPEGKVGLHVKEVLNNIDQLNRIDDETVQRLRITAIAHDTFKYKEAETIVAGNRINHGLLARQYMEQLIDDEVTLDLIELHDEIYYSWRHEALHEKPNRASARLENLVNRIGKNLLLHYLFFRCDTMTGDKIQTPRFWFEQKLNSLGFGDFETYFDDSNKN